MPVGLTQTQREQITAALFRRESVEQIAEAHNCSKRQIHRISKFLRQYGTTVPPRTKKMGRPRTLNEEIEDDLRAYVTERPLAQLEDMASYINEKYSVKCSRASLSRWLDKLGFERRIIRRGNRSREKDVPPLSEVDMMRLLSDPSPDTEIMNLPGNSKKARYAWLSKIETGEDGPRKPKRKPKGAPADASDTVSHEPAVQMGQMEQTAPVEQMAPQDALAGGIMAAAAMATPVNYNVYGQPNNYVSPYRTVTPSGGLIIGPSPPMAGQMIPHDDMPPLDPRIQQQSAIAHRSIT